MAITGGGVMNSTTSGMGNITTPRPSADAWCVYEMDSDRTPIILDSCGVSSVTRVVQGVYRVTFTNPERFQSGAYVGLVQPEIGNAAGGYGMAYVQGSTTNAMVTALGQSGSCDIISLGFVAGTTKSSPFSLVDSSNGYKVRYNAAFFCLRSDSDTRKSAVANFLYESENFSAPSYWTQPLSPASLTAVNEVNPFGATSGVYRFNGSNSAGNYFYQFRGSIGVTYTFSLHVKVINGATMNLVCGGTNLNFGTAFNLSTGVTTAIGTPPNVGSNAKITALNNGWNRVSMVFNAPNVSSAPLCASMFSSAANNDFLVFGAQLEEGSVLSPYIPTTTTAPVYGDQEQLLNHSPGAGGSGIGSRQNLLLYSQDFTQAQWSKTYANTPRVGVSAGGFTAPDGTTTAMKLYELNPIGGSTIDYKLLAQYVAAATADQSWMFSVHAKAAERKYFAFADSSFGVFGRSVVDLETGAVTENSASKNIVVESVGDGWQRIIICVTSPKGWGGNGSMFGFSPNPGPTVGMSGESIGIYGPSYHGVSGSGILIWGAQLERGMVYSAYTLTNSTTVGTVFARVAGLTYQSPPTQMRDAREATAWGTIVIPANTGTSSSVTAYLEGAWGCSTVVGRDNSAFDVYFTTPMDSPTYCVITSTEQESVLVTEASVGQENSIPPTDEFTLNTIQNNQATVDTQRTRQSFTISCRRQAPSTNSGATVNGFTEQAIHFQRGRTQRIHFMVFGGRQIRGTS